MEDVVGSIPTRSAGVTTVAALAQEKCYKLKTRRK